MSVNELFIKVVLVLYSAQFPATSHDSIAQMVPLPVAKSVTSTRICVLLCSAVSEEFVAFLCQVPELLWKTLAFASCKLSLIVMLNVKFTPRTTLLVGELSAEKMGAVKSTLAVLFEETKLHPTDEQTWMFHTKPVFSALLVVMKLIPKLLEGMVGRPLLLVWTIAQAPEMLL